MAPIFRLLMSAGALVTRSWQWMGRLFPLGRSQRGWNFWLKNWCWNLEATMAPIPKLCFLICFQALGIEIPCSTSKIKHFCRTSVKSWRKHGKCCPSLLQWDLAGRYFREVHGGGKGFLPLLFSVFSQHWPEFWPILDPRKRQPRMEGRKTISNPREAGGFGEIGTSEKPRYVSQRSCFMLILYHIWPVGSRLN